MYFDHSATTPVHPDVQNLINITQKEVYGNPSSTYSPGKKARILLEKARKQIAKSINTIPSKIIFNSGGTEANNQVLWSMLGSSKNHVISNEIEHPAVTKVLQRLKSFGLEHCLIKVNKNGFININELKSRIKKNTGLITIMLANNEIGTIQPVEQVVKIAKKHGILVHTDAVQCLGKMNIDVQRLGVDFLSLSAHKFYGPKGVGALYAKNPKILKPLIIGGNQEGSLRSGTENIPYIAAMGLASEIATKSLNKNISHIQSLEKQFKQKLQSNFRNIIFNGSQSQKLPGLVSISFPGFNSDILIIKLDREKIYVSNGSACGSGLVKPSHVLEAIGLDESTNLSTLRFSFGISNNFEEIEKLIHILKNKILK